MHFSPRLFVQQGFLRNGSDCYQSKDDAAIDDIYNKLRKYRSMFVHVAMPSSMLLSTYETENCAKRLRIGAAILCAT